jgi:hypothetical protein
MEGLHFFVAQYPVTIEIRFRMIFQDSGAALLLTFLSECFEFLDRNDAVAIRIGLGMVKQNILPGATLEYGLERLQFFGIERFVSVGVGTRHALQQSIQDTFDLLVGEGAPFFGR